MRCDVLSEDYLYDLAFKAAAIHVESQMIMNLVRFTVKNIQNARLGGW
jgi:hypothetical protein